MRLIEHVTDLAQITDTTGQSLRHALLNILGSFLIVVIAFRAAALFLDDKWGRLVTLLLGGAVVAGFCFFPDQATDLLKSLWTTMFGSST